MFSVLKISNVIPYNLDRKILNHDLVLFQNRSLWDGDENVREGEHFARSGKFRQVLHQDGRPIDRNRYFHVSWLASFVISYDITEIESSPKFKNVEIYEFFPTYHGTFH